MSIYLTHFEASRTHTISVIRPWPSLGLAPSYTCPVCGNPEMREPPERYFICPCCGTEFENDDEYVTHSELRAKWIDGGMKWWSSYNEQPEGWDPVEQLRKLAEAEGVE